MCACIVPAKGFAFCQQDLGLSDLETLPQGEGEGGGGGGGGGEGWGGLGGSLCICSMNVDTQQCL